MDSFEVPTLDQTEFEFDDDAQLRSHVDDALTERAILEGTA